MAPRPVPTLRREFAILHRAEGSMKKIAVVLLIASAAQAYGDERRESAFGFWKGMTVQQAKAAAPLEQSEKLPSLYMTKVPPRPVYPLRYYSLRFGSKTGLCIVDAQTEHEQGERRFKAVSNEVFEMLIQRYGRPSQIPKGEKDEKFIVRWDNPQGPDTLIEAHVDRDRLGGWYVMLRYYFANSDACVMEGREGL
jgi:hypothetical protein